MMRPELQPSSDGFPEELIDQRFLARGPAEQVDISALPACLESRALASQLKPQEVSPLKRAWDFACVLTRA